MSDPKWPTHKPYTLRSSGWGLGTPVHVVSFEDTDVDTFQAPRSFAKHQVHLLNVAYSLGVAEGQRIGPQESSNANDQD